MELVLGVGMFLNYSGQANAAYNKDKTADLSTGTDWSSKLSDDTSNVGRIWTDKSVSTGNVTLTNTEGEDPITVNMTDNSDFLVSLSAMSSASSLTGTGASTPLDIVLVLDVSGSMDDRMYTKTYDVNRNSGQTYYVWVDGDYEEVSYFYNGWYYGSGRDRVNVTPKTDENDTQNTQFYIRSNETKLSALKSAVNRFIGTTATANAEISNDADKHQIFIVKLAGRTTDRIGNSTYQDGRFTYNYTQIVQDLTVVNENTSQSMQNTVNRFEAAGATSADYAMEHASTVLSGNNVRENEQKVVILFTDDEPNHGSGFDGSVAADTVNEAYDLKEEGTLIYTIGVFGGADPSDTTEDFNQYMHGVSGNYRDARCTTTSWGGQVVETSDWGTCRSAQERTILTITRRHLTRRN